MARELYAFFFAARLRAGLAGASSTASRSCSRGTGAGRASSVSLTSFVSWPSTAASRSASAGSLRARRTQLGGEPVDAVLEPVERLLDALQPGADGAQPPRQPVDVGRRRQVQRAHRRLLRVDGLLARGERPRDRAVDQRVLEQVGGELAERLLALTRQPVAQALLRQPSSNSLSNVNVADGTLGGEERAPCTSTRGRGYAKVQPTAAYHRQNRHDSPSYVAVPTIFEGRPPPVHDLPPPDRRRACRLRLLRGCVRDRRARRDALRARHVGDRPAADDHRRRAARHAGRSGPDPRPAGADRLDRGPRLGREHARADRDLGADGHRRALRPPPRPPRPTRPRRPAAAAPARARRATRSRRPRPAPRRRSRRRPTRCPARPTPSR